jgi:hypothetical protein
VTQPSNGTVTFNANGDMTYTPKEHFNGTDSLTYRIIDGKGGASTAKVTFTVKPVNDEPVALDDAVTLDEDTSKTFNILANDTDPDGDTLVVDSIVTQPANGAVVVNADGTLTYTPKANFNGTDSLVYKVSDGKGGFDTAKVTLTVKPVNDAPVAKDDSVTMDEDTSKTFNILANDSDPDGDTITIDSIVTQPTHGTITYNANGDVTYTPTADFFGDDSFVYKISDGKGGFSEAKASIKVNQVNEAAKPVADVFAMDEDQYNSTPLKVNLLANDTDRDGDALKLTGVTLVSSDQYNYVYNGSFERYSGKSEGDSNWYGVQTVYGWLIKNGGANFEINPNTGTISSTDGTFSMDLEAHQNENMHVYQDVAGLANGVSYSLSLDAMDRTGGNLLEVWFGGQKISTVDPSSSYGNHSFTITGGQGDGGNRLELKEVGTKGDSAGVSIDNVKITHSPGDLVSWNENGDVEFKTTPHANGDMVFKYTVSDGRLSSESTATFKVKPINDVPLPKADLYVMDEDQYNSTPFKANILANDTDIDNDALKVVGVKLISAGLKNYVLNGSFESFSGKITGGTNWQKVSTVDHWKTDSGNNFEINNGGIPASDGSYSMDMEVDKGQNIRIWQYIEGLTKGKSYQLSFDARERTSGNLLEVWWGMEKIATIDPNSDYKTYSLTIKGGDGDGSDKLKFREVGSDGDAAGVSLDNVKILEPLPGELISWNEKGDVEFKTAPNASGEMVFEYEVSDGKATAKSTATFKVNPVVEPLEARPDAYVMDEDQYNSTALKVNLLTNDVGDGMKLKDVKLVSGGASDNFVKNGSFETFSGVSGGGTSWHKVSTVDGWGIKAGGSLFEVDGKSIAGATDGNYAMDMEVDKGQNMHIYQDIKDLAKGDSYTLSLDAYDRAGTSGLEVWFGGNKVATVDASHDNFQNYKFTIQGGQGNGGDRLELKEIGDTGGVGTLIDNVKITHGSPGQLVSWNESGEVQFKTLPDASGEMKFEYTMSNGESTTKSTATFTVNPVNDAPDAVKDWATVKQGGTVRIDLLKNDSDKDGDDIDLYKINDKVVSDGMNFSVSQGKVTVVDIEKGLVDFTANSDACEGKIFNYTITDNHGGFDSSEVCIKIDYDDWC